MSQQAIAAFSARVEGNPELHRLISRALSPVEVVDLAASLGFRFTAAELRRASRDLATPYWPWASQGRGYRYQFFLAGDPAPRSGSTELRTRLPLATRPARSAA